MGTSSTQLPGVRPNHSRSARNRSVPAAAGPAAAGVLLDLPETSSQLPATIEDSCSPAEFVNPDYVPFEHRGWLPMRRRVQSAFVRLDVAGSRQFNFAKCCENVHVYVEPQSGDVEYRCERCHDRFCLPCGQLRSRQIARVLEPLVRAEPSLFITLTVRGKPADSLASLLDKLSEAWKALRRIPYWAEHVKGGAIMTEIKWSRTSGGHWHPHYHIVANGAGLDPEWLKQTWNLITRDSDQVNVKEVADVDRAISYVVKYASKPLDSSFVFKPELLDEAIKTLKGRRLCACFGSWYGTPLSDSGPIEEDGTEVLTTWRYAGTTRDLAGRAERGDTDARVILSRVERMRSLRYAESLRRRGLNGHGPPVDASG